MIRILSILVGLAMVSATTAQAQSFSRCAGYQTATVQAILPGAHDLALAAAVSVGDTPSFAHWFGTFEAAKAERVRENLKRIYTAIRDERIRFFCGHPEEPACKGGVYAYVYRTEPYAMTLCPDFFTLPTMPGGGPSDAAYEYGTMEGTIIHEMSHFEVVANTDDICYGRTECARLARTQDYNAVINADTYQYFSEDIGFAVAADAAAQ